MTYVAPAHGNHHVRFMGLEGGPRRGRRRGGHRGMFGFVPGGPPFGGRKARRGDIRAAILALLAEAPMHGYQIIQELSERTEGVWRPSPGSVYPTLQQLEDEELIAPTQSESGKRVFALTDAGRETVAANPAPWEAVAEEADDAVVNLWELARQVLEATRQVAATGSAGQVDAAQTILRDARKALYRLLADD
ncbi:MAG: PadR family transcriptional regulator [Gaiellales bacterium]